MRTIRNYLLLILCITWFTTAHSQLAAFKMIGKNSSNAKIGFGTFAFTQIPLNEVGNRNVVIEYLDFAFFPQKNEDLVSIIAYLSIKAGYKYIFSEESNTGFYVEPSVGYCRVVSSDDDINGKGYGDGIAVAGEAGYILGVGQRDNTINFGVKYETDMAGAKYKVSSIGLRVSYSFHLFRKRRD